MSRVLFFDCFSGISGDMVIGALVDAGFPLAELTRALGAALDGAEVRVEKVMRAGVQATKFHVGERHGAGHDHGHHHHERGQHHHDHHEHDHHDHPHEHSHAAEHAHRSLPEIFAIIDRSALSQVGRAKAKGMFERLAEAEAAIHNMPVAQVHLHEVGALDSIVDIMGAVCAMEWAGADRIVCSALNVGGGMVDSAHGRFPVPAPATLKLLATRDVPIYSGLVQKELVTPTGALIATTYAERFGVLPAMTVERIGYGAGTRDPHETPNVLRVVIGREASQGAAERVVVVECEIDDMNPQIFGVVMERLYAAGALEVFYAPVQMKKNRPGTLMTVIAPPRLRPALLDIVFAETTTIGVRFTEVERECLARAWVTVSTSAGPIRIKLASRNGAVVNAAPEFADCEAAAKASGLPVKDVQALAMHEYLAGHAS